VTTVSTDAVGRQPCDDSDSRVDGITAATGLVTTVSAGAAAAGEALMGGFPCAPPPIDSLPPLHSLPTVDPPGVMTSSRAVDTMDIGSLPIDRLVIDGLPDARGRSQRIAAERASDVAALMSDETSPAPLGGPRTAAVLHLPPASSPIGRRRLSKPAPPPNGFGAIMRGTLAARSALDSTLGLSQASREASHDAGECDDVAQSAIQQHRPGFPVRRASVGGGVAASVSEVGQLQVRRGSAGSVRPSPASETRASSAGWVARRGSLGAQRLSGINLTRQAAWAYKVWI